jgi:Fe2+ or Zn2+ uptake regulation protein
MGTNKNRALAAGPKPKTWVQTERKAHESWALLIAKKPRAAQLLHVLVAHMGHKNAVVASLKVLSDLMGVSTDTVRRSIKVLKADNWVQVVSIGKGREAAYVVNDRVAWGEKRATMNHLSTFSAEVIADRDDQDAETLETKELRGIPHLYPGEHQAPAGDGIDPPSQPSLEGLEPDLPAIMRDPDGNEWEVNRETGETEQIAADRR